VTRLAHAPLPAPLKGALQAEKLFFLWKGVQAFFISACFLFLEDSLDEKNGGREVDKYGEANYSNS